MFDTFSSKCVCKEEDGCDERCQNRIMLYECDDNNCNVGKGACGNRAFDELQERRKAGGKYRIGVEVLKTADRGYGVRSNRCFEANQIIVEYTGEIITEDECDRRMNEVYKHNEVSLIMPYAASMLKKFLVLLPHVIRSEHDLRRY
jgi:histone-lysine N-methyltransferase ASH1L